MESLEHATAETAREEVVRLLSAAERGDHDVIDGTKALAHLERLTCRTRTRLRSRCRRCTWKTRRWSRSCSARSSATCR